MTFLLRILFSFSLIYKLLVVTAQQSDTRLDNIYGLDPLLHNGRSYTYFLPSGTGGSQYLFNSKFESGSVTIRGVIFNDLELNYDIFNQEIILQYKDKLTSSRLIILSDSWLESFRFRDLDFELITSQDSLKKIFQVLGPQTGLTELDPLMLVDLVAIDNPALVLAISPQNISRIEVVNQLYIKGDQAYGGIINIISKRGDFAGIDLPSSGVFLKYSFLTDSIYMPEALKQEKNIPDTRNTLYWEPKLNIYKDSTTKISFAASDTPGKYQVTLNGINSKGEVLRQSYLIDVIK